MSKILLLGASGQVGHELVRCLNPLGELIVTTREPQTDGIHADLTDLTQMAERLDEFTPDIIVNAAAYTAVDRAEDEPELARRINTDAPAFLARYAAQRKVVLIHYSTDYVFDGDADNAYTETDPTAPVSVYGHTKKSGEDAIRASGCRHLILRSAWVYGHRGRNFLRAILAAASQRHQLRIVRDQWGTPTWSRMLAQLTAAALHNLMTTECWDVLSGTYHLSSTGSATNWYEFACGFLRQAQQATLIEALPEVIPIASEAYPTRAHRPRFSVLDNRRFEQAFHLKVPDWKTQLRLCMDDCYPHRPND